MTHSGKGQEMKLRVLPSGDDTIRAEIHDARRPMTNGPASMHVGFCEVYDGGPHVLLTPEQKDGGLTEFALTPREARKLAEDLVDSADNLEKVHGMTTEATKEVLEALKRLQKAVETASFDSVDGALAASAAMNRAVGLMRSMSHGGTGSIRFKSERERDAWATIAAGVASSLEPLDWQEEEKLPDGRDMGEALLQWHVTRITLVTDLLFHDLRDRDAERKTTSS